MYMMYSNDVLVAFLIYFTLSLNLLLLLFANICFLFCCLTLLMSIEYCS